MRRSTLIVVVLMACGGAGGEPCTNSGECAVTDLCSAANRCEASPAPEFITKGLPSGAVNAAYTARLVVHGGSPPYRFSLGEEDALPAGLSMNQGGTITGTPSGAGAATFSVTVTDAAARAATMRLGITIRSP